MAFAQRLESLEKKHRDLENAIHDLEKFPSVDELAVKRLKIEKLALKDKILQLATETMDQAAE